MDDAIVRLTREALMLVLVVSGPPIAASLLVGLVVSVFQATTQIQEQTLTFVPKLIAVFATLAALGPWIATQLGRFTEALFAAFPHWVGS
jgi:flagellar biosynthetic protein FliQ